MKLLLTWIINAAALFLVPYVLHSVEVESFSAALFAALLLGFVNALIRPLIVLLTLPVTVITLGLFVFIINGILFLLVSNLVPGFQVASLWAAIGGAILYSIISWALSTIIFKK